MVIMSDISEATHEFRQGDNSSLFSTIRCLIKNMNGIDDKRLSKLVHDKIHQIKELSKKTFCDDINENNKIRKNTCDQNKRDKTTDKEDQLEALVLLCRFKLSVVFVTQEEQITRSVYVRYYGRNSLSFQECGYIIYDETYKHYAPLCLFNKSNPDDSRTTFDRNDNTIKALLRIFFKEHLNYDKSVELTDQIDNKASDVLPRVQNESENISGIIALDTEVNTSKTQIAAKSDEHLSMSNTSMKTPPASRGIQLPSNMNTSISNTTHEFRIGELHGDDQCLFSCSSYLFDRSQSINIKSLRKKVANFIWHWKDIEDIRLLSSTDCQTRKDYCLKIEEGTIWTSEPERYALADLYPNNLFCVISKIKTNENEFSIVISTYVKDISSYKKCVIMVYDAAANHYKPVYLYDKVNHEEEKTNFTYNDTVKKLLGELIQKTFNYHGYINFDSDNTSYEVDRQSHREPESDVSDKILISTTTNLLKEPTSKNPTKHDEGVYKNTKKTLSKKRKTPEADESPFVGDTTRKFTSLILPTTEGIFQSPTSSRSIPSNDQIYTRHRKNDVPSGVEQLLQSDVFCTLDPSIVQTMKQHQQTEFSSNLLLPDATFHHDAQNQPMKFETEPIERFRGRLLSEYSPKKQKKRDGTEVKTQNPPSYFPDLHNRHYLNLLIPETFLFGDLRRLSVEITIITATINGCIYIHPYFKFYVLRHGSEPLTINPLYIYLGFDKDYELKRYSEGIRSLIFYLSVIMLKNDELLQNQPIQPFQSSFSNGRVNRKKYDKFDEFKHDFQLNDLRFAVTLWIKDPRGNAYHRCVNVQYISQISTQDKTFKVSSTNIS